MRQDARAAFSLIELLVVLGIVVLLSALLVPSVRSILSASSLTQTTNDLVGLLSLARQTAQAQNTAMEVRFYQFADPLYAGESSGNPGSGKFRALQIFQINGNGPAITWAKMKRFDSGIIIDANPILSSLLAASPVKSWTPDDPQPPLPGLGTDYLCRAFRFRADGSLDFPATPPNPPGTWCLTLHPLSFGDNLATPPPNFATLQIDALTGTVTSFRP